MVDSLEIFNVFHNILQYIFGFKDNKVYINFCKYAAKNIEKDNDSDNEYHVQMLAVKRLIKALHKQFNSKIQECKASYEAL